jgi:Zn-dependent M16 (insulinase) family peptidase
MASRENTEADLLDLELRRLIYNRGSTYSFECGGLTKDIMKLNNADIKHYHQTFYHVDNLAAIICGMIDPETLFEAIYNYGGLLETRMLQQQVHSINIPKKRKDRLISSTIKFPSSEMDVGSIAYGNFKYLTARMERSKL